MKELICNHCGNTWNRKGSPAYCLSCDKCSVPICVDIPNRRFAVGNKFELDVLNEIIETEGLELRASPEVEWFILHTIISDNKYDYHTSRHFMSNRIEITKILPRADNEDDLLHQLDPGIDRFFN